MKGFFALALFVGVAYAMPKAKQDEDGCATCIKGTKMLMDFLNTEESLGRQVELLIAEACSLPDFDEGCDVGVSTWWPQIGHALYPTPQLTAGICASLDESCEMPMPKAWDCDTCKSRIADVGGAMVGGTEQIVMALTGGLFCENEMNEFDADQMGACKTFTEAFVPAALMVLDGAIGARGEDLCNEIYDNICMA